MYCWQCGTKNPDEGRFCTNCGAQLVTAATAPSPAAAPPNTARGMGTGAPRAGHDAEEVLWSGRPVLSGLQSLGTLYEVTTQRLRIHKGVLGRSVDELELVRVKDVGVEQDLGDRVMDTGDVILTTTDKDTPMLRLKNVADPHAVKEIIRAAVRAERERRAGQYREIL